MKVFLVVLLISGDYFQIGIHSVHDSMIECDRTAKEVIRNLPPAYRLSGIGMTCLRPRPWGERLT